MLLTATETSNSLSFSQDELRQVLDQFDPRYLWPVSSSSDHIVRMPGREDLYLRWATASSASAHFPASAQALQQHVDTYELRLRQLTERGVVVAPRHITFLVDQCPRLGVPVAYTVVERLAVEKKFDESSNQEVLLALGHTILDHHLEDVPASEPRIWDGSKLKQYGMVAGKLTILDLDPFLSRDPRTVYPKMIGWVQSTAHYDNGALYRRTRDAYAAAKETYADNSACKRKPWEA